jgi:hypothetical protein
MSQTAAEAVTIVEKLPNEMAQQVLDNAHQLAEEADDAEWDRISSEVGQRASFQRFSAEAIADIQAGRTEPLDLGTSRQGRRRRASAQSA